MNTKFFLFFSISCAAAYAEDLSNGSEGTNVEISKGYTFSALMDSSGKPAGAAYAYLGGKVSQVQPQPTYYSTDGASYIVPSPTSVWLNQFTSASYFVAGVAAALSIWYVCSIAIPSTKKSISDFVDEKRGDSKKDAETDKTTSRRRRAVRKEDDEMTRLATIVLTAVQSGECLQKSICMLGSQVSTKKGRLADSLLSTLLPDSIQQSDYYIILKKSLRGEVNCERFGCPH